MTRMPEGPLTTAHSDTPEEEQPQKKQKLTSFYVVGVKEDGSLHFEIGDENITMVDLLGLHKYAEIRVKNTLDVSNETGDGLVAKVANIINARLDAILSRLTPDTEREVQPEDA